MSTKKYMQKLAPLSLGLGPTLLGSTDCKILQQKHWVKAPIKLKESVLIVIMVGCQGQRKPMYSKVPDLYIIFISF